MIPQKIKAFERMWYYEYTIMEESLLSDNTYSGLNNVILALYETVKPKILSGTAQKSFDEIFAVGSQNLDSLEKGNLHYMELVRRSTILNEHNIKYESREPLTRIVKNIISEFSGVRGPHENTLTIYGTLENLIATELGKTAAIDADFQTYERWRVISRSIIGGHEFYRGWMDNLSIEVLKTEASKIFARAEEDQDISSIAYIDGDRGKNTEASEAYLKMLTEHKDLEPFAYIDLATRGQGLLYFKEETAFDESLMCRAGLENWLRYCDRLKYPNLQGHFLYSITEPADFPILINMVLKGNDWITPKVYLVLLILQRYYDLLDKGMTDLSGYTTGHIPSEQPQRQQIAERAKEMSKDWMEHLLPESFAEILEMIVKDQVKHEGLLHSVLLWACSHNKLYVRAELQGRIKLIDTIQNALIKSFTDYGVDVGQLTNTFQYKELNWMLFGFLHRMFTESTANVSLRDGIFKLYLIYFGHPKFFYSSGGEANLNEVINNSYYFSSVLAAFDDPYEEWSQIYKRLRIHHQGWLENRFEQGAASRESFLITTGIGLSYFFFSCDKKEVGNKIMKLVSSVFLKQTRSGCGKVSVDYEVAVIFLGATINTYCDDDLHDIVSKFTFKLDDLELLLKFWNQLVKVQQSKPFPFFITKQLKTRIESEFWMIENHYKRTFERNTLDFFIGVKDRILMVI